jgi:phosphoribosyl-ATP pyrophosphohydrolase/phosphoribosyl-AMP cyclohydrolase/histidinol dehydrogenase
MTVTILPLAKADQIRDGSIPSLVGFLGGVFFSVKTADEAIEVLQVTAARLATYINVTALESAEDIVLLVDAGATTVIVNKSQLAQLDSKKLALDRVALLITGMTKEEVVEAAGDKSVGMFTANVTDVEFIEAWLNEYGKEHPPFYVSFESPSEEHAIKVAKLGGIPVIPVEDLYTGPGVGSINAAKVLLAGAETDRPDGLFTTLVTDERGVALGLVYSNETSVVESLKTGRGVYQSRKRGLWYKGDSSGDIQELIRVTLDCDQDCLQFVVRQKGKGMVLNAF